MTRYIEDFTIFGPDGVTPWFGSADEYGEIIESDFQTPDTELAHDRPYLLVPEGFSPSETDFLNGSSRIGAGQVSVLDKRLTASDQASGIVTSRVKDAPGCRAVRRRYIDGAWRTRFEGMVHRCTIDPSDPLVYRFELRDSREFERAQSLFSSNHVLFGANGGSGPAIDYGQTPIYRLSGGLFGRTLLRAVEPYATTFTLGFGSGPGSAWGVIDGPLNGFNLGQLGNPTLDSDGIWRHKDFRVFWRPVGSSDPYTQLSNMPRPFGAGNAVQWPNFGLPGLVGSNDFFRAVTTLFIGSEDEDEIPTDGQAIEILVLAVDITEETPFWWDGGTLGDLLQEIVDGLHTDEPPRERYDPAWLAEFAIASRPARFKLTEPVLDRRKWVEENIYKAAFRAPAFTVDQEIYPAAWRMPTAAELADAPVIDVDTIQPVGDWGHGTDNAIGEIEFTYTRESLEPTRTVIETESPSWWKFWASDVETTVPDPEDTRLPWQRLFETKVTVRTSAPDAAPGAQTLVYAPVTLRSIGDAEGMPDGGDLQDELGNEIVQEAIATVLYRFPRGVPKYQVDVTATLANLELYQGQWVRVRFALLPEYATGLRGLSHWMQIYAIADPNPAQRRLYLVDGRVPDFTDDPDVVDPDGEDCLDGGGLEVMPTGKAVRVFRDPGRYTITNGCAHTVEATILLVAGGGGGGNAGDVGGGGGAGGVLGVTVPTTITIPASSTVTIDVGAGGSPGSDGDDTIVWLDRVTGAVLDPDTADPDDAYRAVGGGAGGGGGGGSGGGGNATLPISGGGSHSGGGAEAGQGNAGANGNDAGGIATCQAAAGGGGGSFAGAGQPGLAVSPGATGGTGGDGMTVDGWNVALGGGGSGGSAQSPGASGEEICGGEVSAAGRVGDPGFGYGGGGKGVVGAATAGGDGGAFIQYVGPIPELTAPPVTTEVTDENQLTVCVSEDDWQAIELEGYRVRVEYAIADSEPAADSGEWRLAGYLDAPGCVTTNAAPTGGTLWTRAIAEARDFLPSDPGTSTSENTPETPGLLELDLVIADDQGTVTWTPNAYAEAVRIRGLVHPAGDSTARPLPKLVDLESDVGTYTVPEAIPLDDYLTLDVEAWENYEPPVEGVPLLAEQFTRADSSTIGGDWVERSGDWAIVSNRLAITDATSGRIVETDAAAVGPAFLQAVLRSSGDGGWPGLVGRFSWNAGAPLGYEVRLRPDLDEVHLLRVDDDVTSLGASEDAYTVHGAAVCAGTWATVQGGAGNTSGYGFSRVATLVTARVKMCATTDQYTDIVRGILVVDVSGLAQPPTEFSVVLHLLAKVETLAGQSVVLTAATPADPDTIASSDYANVGSTAYSSAQALAGLSINTDVTFQLNTAGIAALATAWAGSGKFSIGIRIESDRANAEPPWGSNQETRVEFASRDHATAGLRPEFLASNPRLDSAAATVAPDTDYVVQLYVADGVQQAWAAGASLDATDATFDAQNARTLALRHGTAGSSVTSTFDDVLWFSSGATTKYVTVSGLPAGWGAKILNAAESVVAEATESGGTASIDCTRYGGATEHLPAAGWAHLIVVDDYEDEQDRFSGAIYPGTTGSWDEEAESLYLSGAGRIYRISAQNPIPEIITRAELDDGLYWGDGQAIPSSDDVVLWEDAFTAEDGTLLYSKLPTGSGTWDLSGGELLFADGTIQIPYGILGIGGQPDSEFGFKVSREGAICNVRVYTASNTSTHSSGWNAQRSRGTIASPLPLLAGDRIAVNSFNGYHAGGAFTNGGRLIAITAEDWLSGARGMDITLELVPIGGTALVERFRFVNNGDVAIGALAKLRLDGTAGTGDTYIVESSANALDLVVGGAVSLRLSATLATFIGGVTLTGAQTLQTSTGNLTLATGAGNGNILLSPHGSGNITMSAASVILSADTAALSFSSATGTKSITTGGTTDLNIAPGGILTINPTGSNVVLGHTAVVSGIIDNRWQIHGIDALKSRFGVARWSNNAGSAQLLITKSRGTTVGSFTAVQDNDEVGRVSFYAADGTDANTSAAQIRAVVDGSVTTSRVPGSFEFWLAAGAADDDIALKWTMLPSGVFQSNGAQTLQTSTGVLTLSTAAGNGDVILAPHGTGKVDVQKLLLTLASATGSAGLRVPHGAAPTAPVDGDMWTTTAGLFVRINGATVGPLS